MRGLLGCSIGLDGGGLDGDVRFIRRSGRRAKLQLQTCQEGAERMVCNSEELSALDLELAGLYGRTQIELPKWNALAAKKEQRDWLLDRDACGPAFECLLNSYHQRIKELRNWLH